MTSEQFKLLARGLKAAYPVQSFLPDKYSLRLWYRLLGDVDYSKAQAAAAKHICTSKFPPTIAEFREACASVDDVSPRSWLDGWGTVQKLISKYGYCRPEEAKAALAEADPIAARVVENLGWQNLCMSENTVADRANFRQAYETYNAREKEMSMLPPEIRGSLETLARGEYPYELRAAQNHLSRELAGAERWAEQSVFVSAPTQRKNKGE